MFPSNSPFNVGFPTTPKLKRRVQRLSGNRTPTSNTFSVADALKEFHVPIINTSSMAAPKMSLKLLVDRKGKRVLFAEATKEFVDFLFNIFSLPLGTLIELLGSNQMVGCLGNLKDSIGRFSETYLQPGINKNDVLNPKTSHNWNTLLLSCDAPYVDQSSPSMAIYRCSNANSDCYIFNPACRSNVTVYANAKCPCCHCSMNSKMNIVMPTEEAAAVEEEAESSSNGRKRGYVKEVVTYMVMDNLVVNPMSTISSITLINKFGIKDLSQLEEKTVSFGKDEALKLLKESLITSSVRTAIFLH